MLQPLFELKNVTLIYSGSDGTPIKALDGVNLKVLPGEYITVVGGNGEGKSSLMRIISEICPTEGIILYEEHDISHLHHHKRARFIRYVTQNPLETVSDEITLEEQFSQGLNIGGWLSFKKAVTSQIREKIAGILKPLGLGLENRLGDFLTNFSGGERQAIALAMAVATQPRILLLDEHTAALDFKTKELIEELTDNIIRKHSLTALWITHDLDQAIKFGNRILVISKGKIALDIKGAERSSMSVKKLKQIFDGYKE